MDRRSWLWRRKSSEKSPGETESSGSASSYSERYSDDQQEALRASSNNASPNHAQSLEDSSNIADNEVQETVKKLTEKLSAALVNISAKEDLVKQHMKVAEEAVSGWEKSETELAALKQQLEAAAQKNSALEDRIGHLDGALKESVRQLRQSREEQEQKVHDAVMRKTREWESDKFKLENCIMDLQKQLEAAKTEAAISFDHDLRSKLEAFEKENMTVKVELLARTEDLQMRTLEKELSTRAAEAASKQHLESIKKVAKLEAECRRLQAVARKTSSAKAHKPMANSVCVESITDSQSDSERLLGVENEPSCSDSWASALIAELDQFKNEKLSARNLATSSIEIDLMDDFLEMERLVGMPEADCGSSSFELEDESNRALARDNPLKVDPEAAHQKMADLEGKVRKMEIEKAELEIALADTQNRLDFSHNQLIVAEDKLVVLQRHLDSADESKLVAVEEKGRALESQLEVAQLEVGKLCEKVAILQGQVEKEKAVSAEFVVKAEAVEARRKALESQLESANFEVKKLHDKVYTLEVHIEEEKAVSAEFVVKAEAIEARRKALESQLESANFEVKKLHENVYTLEVHVEEEKAVSSELAAKIEDMEVARKALECQLESANFEVKKLCEKVVILENQVEEEKAIAAQFAAKVEAVENTRKTMERQLESSHLEVSKLHDEVVLLEAKVEEERLMSAKFAVKVDAAEASRKAVESQLESAHLELGELHNKVCLLEEKLVEEKALSAQLEPKYQNYEVGLSRKKQEDQLQLATSSNGELKVKQEKELAIAAGKLADCQKTIASLSRQLKSLTALDDFMLEVEKPEVYGCSPDLGNGDVKKLHTSNCSDSICSSALSNGKERGSPPSYLSPSSALSGFTRLISRVENQ